MFVRKERFEREMRDANHEIAKLHEKYWDLQFAHLRLLNHFGLMEITKPEITILMKKGGPEQP